MGRMTAVAAFAAVAAFVGCSLTTSLDGYAGPPEAALSMASEAGDAPSGGGDDDAESGTTLPPGTPSYVATILADAPVAYWRLGESTTAGGAKEEIKGVAGTFAGPIQLGAPGAITNDANTAATFDGVSTLVDTGAGYEFRARAVFSLEAWVLPAHVGDGNGHRFMGRRSSDYIGYRFYIDGDGTTKLDRWVDANTVATAKAAALSPGFYSHVVATYDGSSSRIYINGVLAAVQADTLEIPAVDIPFVIGAASIKTFDFFEGSIDEVAVYDHVLTDDQVATHYRRAGR